MFDDLEVKKNINVDLKEVLPKKFYNDIVKCNFLNDIKEMVLFSALINLDIEDLKLLSKGDVVGTISQIFTDLNADYNINLISDNQPSVCLIKITSGKNISINSTEKLIDKIRAKYSDLSIIFGTGISEEYGDSIKVQALLVSGDFGEHEKERKLPEENVNLEKEDSMVKQEYNKNIDSEADLLKSVASYCIFEPISMNSIQNEFNLGFNRASNVLSKLESLGIIGMKDGTKKRILLIQDEKEIIKRIDSLF